MAKQSYVLIDGAWTPVGGSGSGSGHAIQDEGAPLATRSILNFTGTGVTAYDDEGNDATIVTILSGTGGHIIQDEGTPLTSRSRLDFMGAGVTVFDDAAFDRTIVDIPSGNGHTIMDEGIPLPTRLNLNFLGQGVTVTDSPTTGRTNVNITAAQGYAPDPSGQPDGKQLEVKSGAYIFVNRPFIYSTAPPSAPRDGDVWIERSI